MPSMNVKVLCMNAHGSECTEIMRDMKHRGFTEIKEVFNCADADIIAKVECSGVEDTHNYIDSLMSGNEKKISQIGFLND